MDNEHKIYTLWASMPDDTSPWMIASEDDFSWQGNPDRCEAVFKAAQDEAKKQDWDVREVTLLVDYNKIIEAFIPTKVEVDVEDTP